MGPHGAHQGVHRPAGPIGDGKPAGGRPHSLLGVGECRFLVGDFEATSGCDASITNLTYMKPGPRVLLTVEPDSLPLEAKDDDAWRYPAQSRVPRPRPRDHRVEFLET